MKWIKCSDRLPEPDIAFPSGRKAIKVFVWGGIANGDSAMFYDDTGFSTTIFKKLFKDDPDRNKEILDYWKKNITHWMEIEPPEDYMKPKHSNGY